jgi:hypothetical protein
MQPIATVINNNLASGMWHNLVETEPNVTLGVGTRLFLDKPFAEIGSPLAGGFFAGEMTINGERFALIVAPKAEGEKSGDDELQYKINDRYTADGTDSDDDGLFNTNRINDVNHPAAQFCRTLRIGDCDDWYLPSRDELMMIWRNLGPNRKNTPESFRAGAPEAFKEAWHWSSTEHASSSNYAWFVGFYGGTQYGHNKNGFSGVRAVRRFKI